MSQSNSQKDSQWGMETGKQTTTKLMQEILPRLYLGDLKAAENIEDLRRNNISFVLTVKAGNFSLATRKAYLKARISQIHIQKQDCVHEELLSTFEPACDMIQGMLAKGKAVLVHCVLGRSRSASIVIAYVMRHLNMSCQEAEVFVRSKRAVINPNSAFREQLGLWEKSRFNLQKVLIEEEFCAGYLSCMAKGKEGMVEAKQQVKQQPKRGQEEVEEKKKGIQGPKDEKEAEKVKKEGESGGNEKADEQRKDKKQDEILEADRGTEEAKTKASPSAHDSTKESTSPQGVDTGLTREVWMHVKSQEPQNIDDHSTTNKSCDLINKAATESPSIEPAPEVVHAAIKPLYLKHPAMGKKKLLRILNADQGWSIGSKEFRCHLEAVEAGIESEGNGNRD